MTSEPGHIPVISEEQAELRRTLDVGLAHVDGRLALHAQRVDQTAKDVAELNARVVALEHNRWPLPAIAALTAVGALAVAIWQAIGR
ncbi:hypothetical protein [Streptomyces sp. NPDC060194]|uniref:hypothetical protein n=1 Tax=Streptomyces sp. NPDC060194 TaxID=3347069 RepID=UPI003648049A